MKFAIANKFSVCISNYIIQYSDVILLKLYHFVCHFPSFLCFFSAVVIYTYMKVQVLAFLELSHDERSML